MNQPKNIFHFTGQENEITLPSLIPLPLIVLLSSFHPLTLACHSETSCHSSECPNCFGSNGTVKLLQTAKCVMKDNKHISGVPKYKIDFYTLEVIVYKIWGYPKNVKINPDSEVLNVICIFSTVLLILLLCTLNQQL